MYIGWPICGQPATVNLPGLSGLRGVRGLGCTGCGGGCNRGLGYFDTGWDISGWSWMEWGSILLVAYMVISSVTTTQRTYRKVRRRVKRFKERA
jgi:hypothetical protein